MRAILKTSYDQDVALARDKSAKVQYGALLIALIALPLVLDRFWLGEVEYILVLAIAGCGLMLLTGFTGLVSIGHAAFLGIGAYAQAALLNAGLPFPVTLALAALGAALAGAALGLPTLRLTGIYLAIATVAFGFLAEQAFIRWESVTGGHRGLSVPRPTLLGVSLTSPPVFYYICLATLILVVVLILNLMRSPTGRAFAAIRDSEIAAQSMGVNLVAYRTLAFALSAGVTGLAGALIAHKIGYLAPEAFSLQFSIKLLLLVVIGGLGSVHGAIYGAIVVGLLPQLIAILRDYLPAAIAEQPGLEPGLFGLLLVLCVIYEPHGIHGRWRKLKLFGQLFPLYPKATFARAKAFARSERNK